jgi:hypothetical protein
MWLEIEMFSNSPEVTSSIADNLGVQELTRSRDVPANEEPVRTLRIKRPPRRWTQRALADCPDWGLHGPCESAQGARARRIRVSIPREVAEDELEQVRNVCRSLGVDDEMTELVLAAHRYDRTLLDVVQAGGGDLRDYVQSKLAIWKAVFDEA